jgi:hypothetical protein
MPETLRHGPERGAGRSRLSVDLTRFLGLGIATCILAAAALRLIGGLSFMQVPFPYFMVLVTATKLLGDAAYFFLFPRRRDWVHVADYLQEDFVTFFRFGFPLAAAQAYLLNTGRVSTGILPLWLSPIPATVLFLVNRWLVERAQEKRRAGRGGVPVVRGPEGG